MPELRLKASSPEWLLCKLFTIAVSNRAKVKKGVNILSAKTSDPRQWDVKQEVGNGGKHSTTTVICQRIAPSSRNRYETSYSRHIKLIHIHDTIRWLRDLGLILPLLIAIKPVAWKSGDAYVNYGTICWSVTGHLSFQVIKLISLN